MYNKNIDNWVSVKYVYDKEKEEKNVLGSSQKCTLCIHVGFEKKKNIYIFNNK